MANDRHEGMQHRAGMLHRAGTLHREGTLPREGNHEERRLPEETGLLAVSAQISLLSLSVDFAYCQGEETHPRHRWQSCERLHLS